MVRLHPAYQGPSTCRGSSPQDGGAVFVISDVLEIYDVAEDSAPAPTRIPGLGRFPWVVVGGAGWCVGWGRLSCGLCPLPHGR